MTVHTILIRHIIPHRLSCESPHDRLRTARIVEALEKGRPVPPVVVTRNATGADKRLWTMVDGRHRMQAHIDLGRTEIAAEVLGPVDRKALLANTLAGVGMSDGMSEVVNTLVQSNIRLRRNAVSPALSLPIDVLARQALQGTGRSDRGPAVLIQIDSITNTRRADEYLAGSPSCARKVASMVESLRQGVTLPPIPVFQVGKERFLAGGFHRWKAHQVVGRKEIAAFLIKCDTIFDALRMAQNRRFGADPLDP